MPAPSIFDVLDFEGLLEPACKSVLQTVIAGISPALPAIQVNVSRDSDTSETPRYDLMFASGEEIPQYGAIGQADPRQVAVAYTGVLTALIVTTRPNDNARMDPLHSLMTAIARYAFSAQAKGFNETNLPYLQILQIVSIDYRPQLQENKEQDISELRFAFKFAVRNDAWPPTP